MKSPLIFRIALQRYADKFVSAAYRGILGRAPDSPGSNAYSTQLALTRDLVAILDGMATSREAWARNNRLHSVELSRLLVWGALQNASAEAIDACAADIEQGRELSEVVARLVQSRDFWERQLECRSEELAQAIHGGLTPTAAKPETIQHYAARLRETKSLGDLASSIAATDEHWESLLAQRGPDLALTLYRRIFHRDPDSRTLALWVKELAETKDLSALLALIAHSDEYWDVQVASRAVGLVRTMYQTLLRREPEPAALSAYAGQLRETKRPADVLRAIADSQELWERLLGERAEELVEAMLTAASRKPVDDTAVQALAAKLRKTKRLDEVFAEIVSSQECWERFLEARAEELIEAVYQGLLKRPPDGVGLSSYLEEFKSTRDLSRIVASIGSSQERERLQRKERGLPHPSASYDQTTWVFLHIQKTAGTSLQNMLVESFGAKNVYREHADVLYLHSPAELSLYSMFAGHFNYDSLAFIPRRRLSIFTFVREPKQRLLSLYNFWRAHERTAPEFHRAMQFANELDIEAFCRCDEITSRQDMWNHMTWCIMGGRQWREWRSLLQTDSGLSRMRAIEAMRPAIRARLAELSFVGLTEDFAPSCQLLFSILGRPSPEPRADHSVAKLADVHTHFKRVEKPTITSAVAEAMEPLVEIDILLYEEARNLYFNASHAGAHSGMAMSCTA